MTTGTPGDRPTFLSLFLHAVSHLYGGIIHSRCLFYRDGVFRSRRLPCTVISVGNITTGGTGKTPLTIWLANFFQGLGYRPSIISRGYGGTRERTGGVVSDGRRIMLGVEAAGDEPYMMAAKLDGVPVLVGMDRFRLGKLALERFHGDLLLLDDGFQHLQLERDLNILLLDADAPFGNGYLVPRGILREPVAQLRRADVCCLTRSTHPLSDPDPRVLRALKADTPLFRCTHRPEVVTRIRSEAVLPGDLKRIDDRFDPPFLKGQKVVAFSGIGDNRRFLELLHHLGCTVTDFLAFSDHHPYTALEIDKIFGKAQRTGVDALVTTEKDYVRIAEKTRCPVNLLVLGVGISFEREEVRFTSFLKERVARSTV